MLLDILPPPTEAQQIAALSGDPVSPADTALDERAARDIGRQIADAIALAVYGVRS